MRLFHDHFYVSPSTTQPNPTQPVYTGINTLADANLTADGYHTIRIYGVASLLDLSGLIGAAAGQSRRR